MEHEHLELPEEKRKARPVWQIWLGRIGFVLFIVAIALISVYLFRGL